MKPIANLSDEAFSLEMQRALRELPDAPPALQRAAIDLWVAPPASVADVARAALNLVRAVLTFDSWSAAPTIQGMRSLRSPTRHLLFNALGRDIDLRITPVAEGYALAGQVLGPDDSGRIELTGPDGRRNDTALDALGEFRIEGLARGSYQLTLQLGGDAIELPAVEVGEAGADAGR